MDDVLSLFALEVDTDALFARRGLGRTEVGRQSCTAHTPHGVATLGGFYLDYSRAEIPEQRGTQRRGDDRRELQHGDPGERCAAIVVTPGRRLRDPRLLGEYRSRVLADSRRGA